VNQQLKQLYCQAETNGDIEDFNLKVLKASLNIPALTEVLVTFILFSLAIIDIEVNMDNGAVLLPSLTW
jgi:hypothetical protein